MSHSSRRLSANTLLGCSPHSEVAFDSLAPYLTALDSPLRSMSALLHRLTGHGGMREGRLGRLQLKFQVEEGTEVQKSFTSAPLSRQDLRAPGVQSRNARGAQDRHGLHVQKAAASSHPHLFLLTKSFLGCLIGQWRLVASGGTGLAPSSSSSSSHFSSLGLIRCFPLVGLLSHLASLDALRK